MRDGHWAASVRESINAVEAMARKLVPDSNKLSASLLKLEQKGYVHKGLKAAFNTLYGYTSDEAGVRHAMVFEDKPNVDEVDALFMLGACASFVSYLIAREQEFSASG
ncbi:hypothetical protein [Alloyangia pacifica]|uniref:hypothetical protein n=1 Tax=Alloyangia pacifica TaxID=311180 RepID=UPI0031E334D3